VCEQQLVDGDDFGTRADQFYADYEAGQLDIDAYLRFALSPLVGQPPGVISEWHRRFMDDKIRPILLPAADRLIADHRGRGHELLIVTATNRFITEPIARTLGIDNLIACEGETVDGVYTGEPAGIPSFQAGKVTRLRRWLTGRDTSLEGAYFYSDSHNDLALLELVDNPVAVDPDAILLAHAETRGWPVISLR
jgi:HAD superfamily hydrolase (TIGR01490 family)